MSFFAKHVQTVLAQKSAELSSDPNILSTNEQLLMQWVEHKRILKTIQSTKGKAEAKATMLPKYAGFIEGVLSTSTPPASKDAEMFTALLVWHIDCDLLLEALPMVRYAIEHQLSAPDNYSRQLPVIIGDEVAGMALKPDAAASAETLAAYIELLDTQDMPDQVRAQLYKAHGYAIREADPAAALVSLQKAITYDEKSGVKKDIEQLERLLKKQVPVT